MISSNVCITVDEAISELQKGNPVIVGTLSDTVYPVLRIQKSFGQIGVDDLYVQYKKNGWAVDVVAPMKNFAFAKGAK